METTNSETRPESPPLRDYLTDKDLENITGIPRPTWRYWRMLGQGPASFKLGRRRLYRKDVVFEWIADQEAASNNRQG